MKRNKINRIKINDQLLNEAQFSILTDGYYNIQSHVETFTNDVITIQSSDILINQVCLSGLYLFYFMYHSFFGPKIFIFF